MANNVQTEEGVLSLLKSVTTPVSPAAGCSREAYQQRLRSFRPVTYFAKPASLSPIVCARFGWTNPCTDMLVCETCKAALSIQIHPNLKTADVRRISGVYRTKLCNGHKVTCTFHSNTFPKSSSTIIPASLASVLPQEMVDLVEQPAPQKLLQKRVQKLVDSIGESRQIPSVDLPPKEMKEFLREGETPEAFISRASAAIGTEHTWAAVLALFGWEPMKRISESYEMPMMHCSTCLAQGRLPVQGVLFCFGITPPAKKQRTGEQLLNPILSHRHYCPFICGFPSEGSSIPVWQTIASNLLRSKESAKDYDTTGIGGKEAEILMKIHRVLKSGIA